MPFDLRNPKNNLPSLDHESVYLVAQTYSITAYMEVHIRRRLNVSSICEYIKLVRAMRAYLRPSTKESVGIISRLSVLQLNVKSIS